MVFQNKAELIYVVRKWNIHHNREIVVTQSKPGYWQAYCRTISSDYKGPQERYHCCWSVSVSTNPDTIVVFENEPEIEEGFDTFKFVFWAFGPAIKAYKLCIPIICIDGTHLKGSYRGKLLTAIGKNANNQIIPVAFALVDEESNESWVWFLKILQENVVRKGKLCVIYDRYPVLHAMSAQMYGWEHRYCLRHIRSNLLSKYTKVKSLKQLCWIVGSITNQILYKNSLRAIKQASTEAWKYLHDADLGKWTVYKDKERSRWGNTTTNIVESLNSVLRHARMMLIKACIEYTFDYTRQHFYDQSRDGRQCNSPLSKNMFNIFNEREKRAQRYKTTCYNEQQGVFKVQSTYQRSGEGGTDYIAEFKQKRCSCGIWQHQRLPCSHAISVCSHLNEDINKCISKKYITPRWREQYSHHFNPLRDASYWAHIQWNIMADPSRLIKYRGRKNQNVLRTR
ncbi:protein FAR1-RELATED SEQUENCE 12-like [Rutidosis leptorrhynchoides]|uniref:protein FAR1-RELATED SEQUENCE 12-like n=1 Tax=Rutidosis leptorrhynchoides TaxID=125765 RepID=UPI003A996B25